MNTEEKTIKSGDSEIKEPPTTVHKQEPLDAEDNESENLIKCPNLSATNLAKGKFFNDMENDWFKNFSEKIKIDHKEFDQLSELGKINLKEWALVESDKSVSKGHHALCPLVRNRVTGQMYRCKIVGSKRIYFNLTTLGFKAEEYEAETKKMLQERHYLFAIDHPFIRKGLGFFTDTFYNTGIILEEFPYGTLLDFYSKNESNKIVCKFTENEIKYFAAQIILALEYMQSIRVVHRDIQAGNVLVDARGYIKLTDFAISSQVPENGRLYSVTCFRYYAAPEYFSGKGYIYSVDFYAFGLTLYEMLTNECFSDQEDIFDMDGSIDWGIIPQEMQYLIDETKRNNSNKDDEDEDSSESDMMKELKAEYEKSLNENRQNFPIPSVEARLFVEDCLIHEEEYRPDGKTARFYDWFNDINFEKLYMKTIDLPFKPDKIISYQPDIDEEYPQDIILDETALPKEFESFKELF